MKCTRRKGEIPDCCLAAVFVEVLKKGNPDDPDHSGHNDK